MENKYVKLGDLDGKQFTVEKAYGYEYKKWDNEARRMLTSEKWQEGFQKRYGLDTSEGKLEVSDRQIKDMLAGTYKQGKADINGVTFKVKKVVGQNDIPNYFFNVVSEKSLPRPEPAQRFVDQQEEDNGIDLSDIPF